MCRKVKILFYVEHVNREIDTINYIVKALKLGKDDYVICSTNFFMGLSKLLYAPDLIVTPWLYSDYCYNKLFSFPFQRNVRALNLHHEQITNLDRLEALLPKGKAVEFHHVSWGKRFEARLLNEGIHEDFIRNTGSLRLIKAESSLSKKEMSRHYLNNEALAEKKWHLFISSFSWKNLPDSLLKKVEKNGRKNVWQYKKIVRESYLKTLDWIEAYLSVYSDEVFIYRLHPSENIDEELMHLKEKYINFHVVSELKVTDWIEYSDIIDLWISTSISEVLLYNKPVRVIRPITLPDNVEIIGFNDFIKVCNVESFLNVDNVYFHNLDTAKSYLKEYYSIDIDPVLATANFVRDILNGENSEISLSFSQKLSYCLRESIKDCIKIFLVKSGFINLTSFKRLKYSYFTSSKVDELL